jgi:hypothetical protein
MKTKLTLTLIAAALSYQANAQVSVTDLGQRVQFGHTYAVDFDGDGDLDLVVGGQNGSSNSVQLYTNDGSGAYTAKTSPLAGLNRPSFDWGDINQNGTLDLLTNGFGPFAGIFTNDGTGVLTASAIALPQIAPNSAFADLNNDGFVDILIFGNDKINNVPGNKSKILFSDKMGGFTQSNQFDSYSFTDPQVSIVDVDNDKDLDLFITAGAETGAATRFSRLFKNNNGVFTETTIAGLFPKGNGSSTWGDYNGDGLPDLLLNGDGYNSSGENADNYRLFKNNGDGTFTAIQAFGYRQNMTGGGGAFLDWNNDGKLDIVVTGYTGTRQATDIYLGDGAGTFTAYANNAAIPGSSEGSVEVGDANGDGQLDLFISGYSGNDWDGAGTVAPYNRNIAVIALNPNSVTNLAPTAPTALAVTGSSTQLNFSWTAGTDATTPAASLTYNFYLKDANGKWFYTPLSDIATGKTKTAKIGNVQYNKGWIVKGLPAGTYTWGAQSIDNSFVGSAFATGTFTIDALGVLPIKIGQYKAYAEGNDAIVKWESLSEVNTNHYLIERSIDGQKFNEIANVKATGGNNTIQNYLIRDKNPSNGTNYYRLTSVDNDQKTQVFDILAVSFKLSDISVLAYPNPLTTSTIKIKVTGFDESKLKVTLYSINGEVINSQTIDGSTNGGDYNIQLNKKPSPGIYNLTISGKQIERTIKLVVQ